VDASFCEKKGAMLDNPKSARSTTITIVSFFMKARLVYEEFLEKCNASLSRPRLTQPLLYRDGN